MKTNIMVVLTDKTIVQTEIYQKFLSKIGDTFNLMILIADKNNLHETELYFSDVKGIYTKQINIVQELESVLTSNQFIFVFDSGEDNIFIFSPKLFINRQQDSTLTSFLQKSKLSDCIDFFFDDQIYIDQQYHVYYILENGEFVSIPKNHNILSFDDLFNELT